MRRAEIAIGRRRVSYLTSESEGSDHAFGRRQPPQTLLFLHAFPLNAEMWHRQVETVPEGWRAIAPDYRGFGGSSRTDSPRTSMNDLAGDVIDLLDRLDISAAVVIGCSLGGYVAFELLASAPHYAKGLVLVDTRAGADTDEGKAGRRKMLETVARDGAAAVADEMTPKLLGDTSKRERTGLVEEVRQTIRSADPDAIRMAVTAMMERSDMTAQLERIHVPTLILAGAEDTLIPRAAIDQMHGAIKGSTLQVIPSAGHLPNLEEPAAFDAELQLFLRQF